MRLVNRWTLGVGFAVVLAVTASADSGHGKRFVTTDDCDRRDATFPGVPCSKDGQVTNAEFGLALPLGHPSWRNSPPYVEDFKQREIRVENTGGRTHTFTQVARFGNGYVAPLNVPGAFAAPECAGGPANPLVLNTTLVPGGELRVEDLEPGKTYNFQCCIHPWMRTTVKRLISPRITDGFNSQRPTPNSQ